MKYKIKNNLLLIISFLILLLLLALNTINYINKDKKLNNMRETTLTECERNNLTDPNDLKFCDELKNNYVTADFFTMFREVVVLGFNKIAILLFLFIVIPSLWYVCRCLKNKILINELLRQNYNRFKRSLFLNSYKSVVVLPIIIIIGFIICWLYTGSLDAKISLEYSTTIWSNFTLKNPLLFILLYTFNLLIHSFLFVNIALIIARKYHNYFTAIILSFLLFIGIEAFLEIAINGLLFTSILKRGGGILFNIMNMLTFNDYYGIISPMIVPFVCMIISFVLVYIFYKNKENLIQDCEKNN